MENFDVYNEQDEMTGEVKPRDQVHKDGTWHRTVHVWIINSKGELLIQRRAPQKELNPNKWGVSSIAGHIPAGDDAVTTAIRESKEEIDLILNESELEYIYTTPHKQVLNDGTYISNHFDDCYLVEQDIDTEKLKLQAGEVSEVKLIHFTELEATINRGDPEFVQHEEYAKLFPILHKRYYKLKV